MEHDEHHKERAFRHKERKENRQQRHISSSKDRSKYKKTDQKKQKKLDQEAAEKAMNNPNLLTGTVIAVRPEGIIVSHHSQEFICVLRGILKKEKKQHKNIVTVGDVVYFEIASEGEGAIELVQERRSVLSRADNLWQRQQQLIAANIDQVLITSSVVIPPIKPSLIDRYIIATRKGHMQPILLFNKIDLLKDQPEEQVFFEDCVAAYQGARIPVICTSTETGEGIDQLKAIMKNKSSVFAGQSGVGKSSLINAVTGTNLIVGEVIEKTKKGSHTTTTAELLPLDFGGWCIDTPGIKSFGMWELSKEEIKNFYDEFLPLEPHCRFPNCSHLHEPDCAVIAAVESGKIHPIRYDSYCSLCDVIEKEHRPR